MITRRDAIAAIGFSALALTAATAKVQAAEPGAVDLATDMILGDLNAPITIIEYSSLTCPHCAHFHVDILPDLRKGYIETGKARFVYRDFPLDRAALYAAALAHCAGKDRFFAFLDILFRSQATWGRANDPLDALKRVGRIGGLKVADIDACFKDQKLLDGILQSRMVGAQTFEVNSTPTFFINGERLLGAQPYENFKTVFDRILGRT